MDPLTVLIGLVVVVHIILLLFLICGSFTFHGEHVGTVTVCHTVKNTEQNKADNSQVIDKKVFVDVAVQTEDADIFYMCYEHIQAQRQENLIVLEVLDEMDDTFADSLYNITDRLDKNFQFLTVQLRAEFDAYLSYALGLQTGEIADVPTPHNLEHPSSHDFPPIPDLVTSFYQPIVAFENFEIELVNKDTNRQVEGGRLLDKLRLWSHKPFGW